MDEFELELKNDFLNEAKDMLFQMEEIFLRLESDRENISTINEIFRIAHNIKGASKAVGFDKLSDVTHSAENLILKIKEKEIPVTDEIINVLLAFKDKLNEIINKLCENLSFQPEIEGMKSQITACMTSTNQPAVVPTTQEQDKEAEMAEAFLNEGITEEVPVEVVPENTNDLWQNMELSNSEIVESANAAQMEPHATTLPSVQSVAQNEGAGANSSDNSDKSNPNSIDETIRVKISRINKLNDIVGELAIFQNVLNQRRHLHISDPLSNKTITQMSKILKEVQEMAMSLRMLPLKQTFQKMSRIVRDTSKALDKNIELHLIGEDTEVDKTVLEKLSDPLVHLVRNAVDHAIEKEDERIASKKDKKGNIYLSAMHEGSNLVLQVRDDGKGIDPSRVREKAINKGIISPQTNLSKEELVQLIFHPGFSTKEVVTEVSGRGVGLDVVKTNIETLGGEVKITSEVGVGSTFKISLPLTLAIVDGLLITVGKNNFVIPLSQVTELIRLDKSKLTKFTGGGLFFNLRGDVTPVYAFNEKFGIKGGMDDSEILILLKGPSRTIGVLVGNVLNQQQIVIKKVGSEIQNYPGLIGAAIMGDGRPTFIIDMMDLFQVELNEKSSSHTSSLNRERAV